MAKKFNIIVIRVEISGSNEIFEVDYVITTVSLGVLKADHESLFEPKLPKRKIEAIQKLGFGLVDKIFLEFDRLWWDPRWSETVLRSCSTRPVIRPPTSVTRKRMQRGTGHGSSSELMVFRIVRGFCASGYPGKVPRRWNHSPTIRCR